MYERKEEIPVELIQLILTNLPVKSILRFKSVSKEWRDIIDEPSFVRDHLKLNQYRYLFWQGFGRFCYLVYDENNNIVAVEEEAVMVDEFLKLTRSKDRIYPLCSYDGLFLIKCGGLRGPNDLGVFIWNPSVGQLTRMELISCARWGAWGIGYDHGTSDYKALRIPPTAYFPRDDPLEVYSFRTNTWSSISCHGGFPYNISILEAAPVNMNCRPHWLADRCDSGHKVYFDAAAAAEDITGELPLPPIPNLNYDMCQDYRSLQVLNGCLCFAINERRRKLSILSMKEYGRSDSWVKSLIISYSRQIEKLSFLTPVYITRAGNVLVFVSSERLAYIDVNSRKFHTTQVQQGHDFLIRSVGINAIPYTLSLVSPANPNWFASSRQLFVSDKSTSRDSDLDSNSNFTSEVLLVFNLWPVIYSCVTLIRQLNFSAIYILIIVGGSLLRGLHVS